MPSRLALAAVMVLLALQTGCGGSASSGSDSGGTNGGKASDTEKGGRAGDLANLQKLFDSMPEDHKPKAERNAVIELDKANAWLKTRADGQTVEVTCKVEKVTLKPDPNQSGRYVYEIKLGEETGYNLEGADVFGLYVAGKVKLGGAEWTTCIHAYPNGRNGASPSAAEADAKRLQGMEGKMVAVKGNISGAKFDLFPPTSKKFVSRFEFDLVQVTIDGFDTQKK
ncbi:hypothetical protein [Urbifossiella limnaea]|uniref:Lipoprotein n=1 Tax=Urbifossiella limnaea TaxID=2528023 RepID=A0A517XQW9_9BACT|nr:hypothetical protein [Urbifossiella limnaea]QDU19862.1 hypothetical protein ETAA1_18000 [Urbifossiella limnaea]